MLNSSSCGANYDMLKFLGLLYFDDNFKTFLKMKYKIKSNYLKICYLSKWLY